MEKICDFLELIVKGIGRIAMWSNGVLVVVIILQVILRYIFKSGMVALEELQWHLYAAGIIIGVSYAITKDINIRLDLISSKFSDTVRDIVELVGILFLLLPFLWIIFYHSLDFVYEAWRLNERSPSPMGLPYRWIVKSLIPFGFGLMILSTVARFIRTSISIKARFYGSK